MYTVSWKFSLSYCAAMLLAQEWASNGVQGSRFLRSSSVRLHGLSLCRSHYSVVVSFLTLTEVTINVSQMHSSYNNNNNNKQFISGI